MLPAPTVSAPAVRIDYLDAVRAFALLLGIVFHASMSFMPVFIGWAVMDVSTSPWIPGFLLVSHSFRMALFFLIAGYLGRLTFHRRGAGRFLRQRFTRIVAPFVVGWFVLRPLIVSGWIMGGASMRGDVDVAAGFIGGFRSLATLPAGLFTGTHLWFLYYLAVITGAFLALRGIATCHPFLRRRLTQPVDAVVSWLASSPLAVFVLALPTAVAAWFMTSWGIDTPDRSLVPQLPVLAIYGGAFALGWMLQRQAGWLESLSRLSLGRSLVAAGAVALTCWLSRFQGQPANGHALAARLAFVAAYSVMLWSLVGLTIGLFRELIRRPSPAVRYLADSSYWLYLLHLPLVVWLQVAFAELAMPWALKLAAISGLTIGASLLVYDVAVRPTLIGAILNGRRQSSALWARLRPAKGSRPATTAGTIASARTPCA